VERLRDMKAAPGSVEAMLAEVIGSSERLERSAAGQRRLFERVLARRRGRPRSGAIALRPVVVGALLLVAGATTAATLAHGWIAREVRALGEAPSRPRQAAAPAPHRTRLAGPREPDPVGTAPPLEAPPPATASMTHPAPRPAVRARASRGEDPSRVVDAIRALRNDHDPLRAGRLLAQYLDAYPDGALAEEAVALSIEAAADRKSPSAAAFAERYLREYPGGRFRRAAEQALQQRQP
jgi:hypothetical protein